MTKPIQIVGGGLSGLTLGIGLRQRGIPTTIHEAGSYPRHRVCGEFISGRGLASLNRLGLLPGIRELGARSLSTSAFFSPGNPPIRYSLPETALGISRFALDNWLAQEFQRLGGDLRSEERWCGDFSDGIVRASGRRAESKTDGWRWFGLKVHVTDVPLTADLEMHLLPKGYVGLARLADGRVNVCGLFRSTEAVPELAQRWREWLFGPADTDLRSRLGHARVVEASFSTVAGLSLHPHFARDRPEVCVGDSLTMIPPLTGNGMSMAFESAELALKPLENYSRGDLPWSQVRREIAQSCDGAFRRRLRWARWVQAAQFHPSARSILLWAVAQSQPVWRALFDQTR